MNSYHADIAIILNASVFEIMLLGIQLNSIFQSIHMTFLCHDTEIKNQADFSLKPHIQIQIPTPTPKTLHITLPIFLIVIHFLYEIPKYRHIFNIMLYHKKNLESLENGGFYGCHTAISFHFITYDLFDYRSFLK